MGKEIIVGIKVRDTNGNQAYCFFCPGCKCGHVFTCGKDLWQFNGNLEKPTFTPSLFCNKNDPKTWCHSNVIDGFILFSAECFHELKNQKVELPDWDSWDDIIK